MPIAINGSGTITGLSTGGLPDGVVDTDMLATDAVSAPKLATTTFVSYAIICDQKAQNTAGGTFTSGAWRVRDLNTEIADPDGIVSISSNEFTLQAGSYLIEWAAPSFRVGSNMSRLYDVTGAAAVQTGQTAYTDVGADGEMINAFGSARVTITASNVYRIEHYAISGNTTSGFGLASNIDVETYTVVKIFKEA